MRPTPTEIYANLAQSLTEFMNVISINNKDYRKYLTEESVN